jgi:hypothetical protein
MKIPVHQRTYSQGAHSLSNSEINDYLCCIGHGMIQFVCAREGGGRNSRGRGSYRSLTENKIIIHPGSVMFRLDPPFIVAGEIVRTSRMYAMSVSPLSKTVLQRIKQGLFIEYTQTEEKKDIQKPAKLKKARDFTNGFHTSLNESLSSLETLIDELDEDVDIEKKHIVNQCYRRLIQLTGNS